jgi:SAM-dependent methyltransferase
MIDHHCDNPKSPKFYVKRYLYSIKDALKDKIVLDIPAGNGATTELLLELGAKAEPYDLFPEYFLLKSIACCRANITQRIPVPDGHADFVICQEGIEHFSDQQKVFRECNRVLKTGGMLIMTTPSYSNIKAKLSYLLFESEYFNKLMPPNEIDSVWMADPSLTSELYNGHIFLTGIQKLRLLAKLAGFQISRQPFMRLNKTSMVFFPLLYPFILISSYITYRRALRKSGKVSAERTAKVYREQLALNISPKTLLDEHLFVIFKKVNELDRQSFSAAQAFKAFGAIM